MAHDITFTPITTPVVGYRQVCACPSTSCVVGSKPRRDESYITNAVDGAKIKLVVFEEMRVVIDALEFVANGIPAEAQDSLTELQCGDPLITVKSITNTGYTTTDKLHTILSIEDYTIDSIESPYKLVLNNPIDSITMTGASDNLETRLQVWADTVEITSGYLDGRLYKIKQVYPDENAISLIGMESALLEAGDTIRVHRYTSRIPWSRLIEHEHYEDVAELTEAIDDSQVLILFNEYEKVRVGDIGYIDREWIRITNENVEGQPQQGFGVTRAINNPYTGVASTASKHGALAPFQIDTPRCIYDHEDLDGFGSGWGFICLQNQKDYYTRITDDTKPCGNTLCPNYTHSHVDVDNTPRRYPKHLHEMTQRWLYRRSDEVDFYLSGAACNVYTVVHPAKSERWGPSLAGLYGDLMVGLDNTKLKMGIPPILALDDPLNGEIYRRSFPHSGMYIKQVTMSGTSKEPGLFIRYYQDVGGRVNFENGQVWDLLRLLAHRAWMDDDNDPNEYSGNISGWTENSQNILFGVDGELRNHTPTNGETRQNVFTGDWVDIDK